MTIKDHIAGRVDFFDDNTLGDTGTGKAGSDIIQGTGVILDITGYDLVIRTDFRIAELIIRIGMEGGKGQLFRTYPPEKTCFHGIANALHFCNFFRQKRLQLG